MSGRWQWVPDGWRVVPEEVTNEMCQAFFSAELKRDAVGALGERLTAAIIAAPEPPSGSYQDETWKQWCDAQALEEIKKLRKELAEARAALEAYVLHQNPSCSITMESIIAIYETRGGPYPLIAKVLRAAQEDKP